MDQSKTHIERACAEAGSRADLAREVGVSPSVVNQWIKNHRPIPVERCSHIERASNGKVMRWDLRPDDWHLIWPELRKRKDAPPIPEKVGV